MGALILDLGLPASQAKEVVRHWGLAGVGRDTREAVMHPAADRACHRGGAGPVVPMATLCDVIARG